MPLVCLPCWFSIFYFRDFLLFYDRDISKKKKKKNDIRIEQADTCPEVAQWRV